MATQKKITRVGDGQPATPTAPKTGAAQGKAFVPTAGNKSKAGTLRTVAVILWVLALAAQIFAISLLFREPVNMTWIIVAIVVDLVLAVAGGLLWKKSNRLDPASEKDRFRFFMQSQLGMVVAAIAFIPLIVVILTNKNIDGKQKGILGGIAAAALVIAGLLGADFNPPSIEQYTEEINRVEWLNNGRNDVFWTKSGRVYHIYSDCQHINTDRTDEIFEGTVQQAHELKNITSLCKTCDSRAVREHNLDPQEYVNAEELLDRAGGTAE